MLSNRRSFLAASTISLASCARTRSDEREMQRDGTPEQLFKDLITNHNFSGKLALRFPGGSYIHPNSSRTRVAVVFDKFPWFLQPYTGGFLISIPNANLFWEAEDVNVLLRGDNRAGGRQTFVFENGIISQGELSVIIRFYWEGAPGNIHTPRGVYLGVSGSDILYIYTPETASRFIVEFAPGSR